MQMMYFMCLFHNVGCAVLLWLGRSKQYARVWRRSSRRRRLSCLHGRRSRRGFVVMPRSQWQHFVRTVRDDSLCLEHVTSQPPVWRILIGCFIVLSGQLTRLAYCWLEKFSTFQVPLLEGLHLIDVMHTVWAQLVIIDGANVLRLLQP